MGASMPGTSFANEMTRLAHLKLAGDLTDNEFQSLKDSLLGSGVNVAGAGLAQGLRQLSELKSTDQVTSAEFHAAKSKLLQDHSTTIVAELTQLLNLRSDGFLSEA